MKARYLQVTKDKADEVVVKTELRTRDDEGGQTGGAGGGGAAAPLPTGPQPARPQHKPRQPGAAQQGDRQAAKLCQAATGYH